MILPVFLFVWGFFERHLLSKHCVKSKQLDMRQTSLLFLTDKDKIVKSKTHRHEVASKGKEISDNTKQIRNSDLTLPGTYLTNSLTGGIRSEPLPQPLLALKTLRSHGPLKKKNPINHTVDVLGTLFLLI